MLVEDDLTPEFNPGNQTKNRHLRNILNAENVALTTACTSADGWPVVVVVVPQPLCGIQQQEWQQYASRR